MLTPSGQFVYSIKLLFLHSIEADAVIMAIPAGPSLSVNFKPKLSVQKTHALRTTPYSSSTKVILAFETPFWDKDNNNKVGGSTLTDLPVKQIYYEMNRAKGGIFYSFILITIWIGDYSQPAEWILNKIENNFNSIFTG